MSYAWNFCTSGAAVMKAGQYAATVSGAALADWSHEAEGTICMKCKRDFVADIGNVSASVSGALQDLASDLIAMKHIAYNMEGFTSRAEAGVMLDFLKDNSDTIIKDLREGKFQDF